MASLYMALEASLVIALFEGNFDEVDRISEQLNLIQRDHPSKLELVKTSPNKPQH